MENKIVTLPGFTVAGIEIRTTNEKAMEEIGGIWGRFFKEGIQEKIPNKADKDIIGLYSEYEGDQTKPFKLLVGSKVTSADNLPEGFVSKTIPSAKYRIFTAKGKMPDCIGAEWQRIWASGAKRAFTYDFELYGEKSGTPENAEVDIYIAVKD